jgi:hypothetical protein
LSERAIHDSEFGFWAVEANNTDDAVSGSEKVCSADAAGGRGQRQVSILSGVGAAPDRCMAGAVRGPRGDLSGGRCDPGLRRQHQHRQPCVWGDGEVRAAGPRAGT